VNQPAILHQAKLHGTGRCPNHLVLLVKYDTGCGYNIHDLGGNYFKRVELSLGAALSSLGS
jgi:hypothetical protein